MQSLLLLEVLDATYVGRDGLVVKEAGNLQDVNLVTNGTFDTDSDWSKGTGWSISGGKARRSGHSVNTDIQQNVPSCKRWSL